MFTPKLLLLGLAALSLIIHLPALISPKKFRKELIAMVSSEETTRLLGLFVLLISFMFLSVHHKLEGGWLMLISIIGWLGVLKGMVYIWNPEFIKKMAKRELASNTMTVIMAIIGIILALILGYIALNYIYIGEVIAG